MKNYEEITYKYLKQQKKRTILTILGIVLSVALITSIGTMAMSLRDKLIRQAIENNGDYHASFSDVSLINANKIKSNVEVKSSGITEKEGNGVISDISLEDRNLDPSAPTHRYLDIKGYDENAFKMLNVKLKQGRLPQNSSEIAVDYWSLKYFSSNPKIGDSIKLNIGKREDSSTKIEMEDNNWSSDETFVKTGEKEYTIVGLLNPNYFISSAYFANGITYLDNKTANGVNNYNVYVKMNSMDNIQSKAKKIATNINTKPKIEYNDSLLRLYAKGTQQKVNASYVLIITFVIGLIIISTVAVIYNAFNISVLERISQFGVLRCVGGTPNQIRKIVLKEAGILSLIGIPLGLFLGVIAMKLVLFIVGFLNFSLLADTKIVISPAILLLSSFLGLFTIYLSAIGPARQAAKVSPLEAVRNSGSVRVERVKKVKKSRLAKFVFGIEGQFANRNLRRNKKRFRITIFSMIISIVLFIVFGSLMDYAFKIGVAQSKSTINYSIYSSGSGIDDDTLYTEVSNIPAVEKAYRYYNYGFSILASKDKVNPKYLKLSGKTFTSKGELSLIDNNSFISYGDEGLSDLKKNLIAGSIDLEAINKEDGVILMQTANLVTKDKNHAIVDITKYKVGDEIEASLYNGEEESSKKLKVMAIISKGILGEEYNQNGGVILITSKGVFQKVSGMKNYSSLFIIAKPNVPHTEITNYLTKLKEDKPNVFYTDYDAQAKQNRNDSITISIFLYGFIGIIILIGCLNIANTISTNLILRTKEFAVLKAVGMTQAAIKKMILLEGVLYGLLAAIYGGILGTLIYYGMFKAMGGIQEVEWVIPWKNILISVIGAIAAALISSLLPMRKINSGIIVEDLRGEN
ncbi:MAG TPA: ABC transporter permease [Clostridiaceae bacterium]